MNTRFYFFKESWIFLFQALWNFLTLGQLRYESQRVLHQLYQDYYENLSPEAIAEDESWLNH